MIGGLKVVKRSPDYRRLHAELQAPVPSDSWYMGHWGFFAFDLRPQTPQERDGQERIVLFTVDLRGPKLESVKVVKTDVGQAEAEVEDLHDSAQSQSLPLPSDW
jgi:hypothetical protein